MLDGSKCWEKNQVKKKRESRGKAGDSSFCGFRKVLLGRWQGSEPREITPHAYLRKTFRAEGIATAGSLRWERPWGVWGTARRTVGCSGAEGKHVKEVKNYGRADGSHCASEAFSCVQWGATGGRWTGSDKGEIVLTETHCCYAESEVREQGWKQGGQWGGT